MLLRYILFLFLLFLANNGPAQTAYSALPHLFLDLSLWGASHGIETMGDDSTGEPKRRFLTHGLDHPVRAIIHGSYVEKESTEKEMAARNLSDLTVASTIVTAATLGVGRGDLKTWFQISHSLSLTTFSVTVAKTLVRRQRPKRFYHPAPKTGKDTVRSFPSGHAAHAFAAAHITNLVDIGPKPLQYGLYGLATVTAYLRMAADRHFLSDVMTGAAMGLIMSHLSFKYTMIDSTVMVKASPESLGVTYFF